MSEKSKVSFETSESLPQLTNELLFQLGEACVETKNRADLEDVARQHQETTGLVNPNSADGSFLFTEGEIRTKDDFVYRQVGAEAIVDLIESGVVRNGATASEDVSRRWGDTVFWHSGQEDRAINTGGRFMLVAPKEATAQGWVTADKLTAIYAMNPQGEVVDLLSVEVRR